MAKMKPAVAFWQAFSADLLVFAKAIVCEKFEPGIYQKRLHFWRLNAILYLSKEHSRLASEVTEFPPRIRIPLLRQMISDHGI